MLVFHCGFCCCKYLHCTTVHCCYAHASFLGRVALQGSDPIRFSIFFTILGGLLLWKWFPWRGGVLSVVLWDLLLLYLECSQIAHIASSFVVIYHCWDCGPIVHCPRYHSGLVLMWFYDVSHAGIYPDCCSLLLDCYLDHARVIDALKSLLSIPCIGFMLKYFMLLFKPMPCIVVLMLKLLWRSL